MTTTAPHQSSGVGSNRLSRRVHNIFNKVGVPCPFGQLVTADIVTGTPAGLGIGTLTIKDVVWGGIYDASATANARMTDDTTDMNDVGTADALAMPATEAIGDRMLMALDPDNGMPFGIRIITSTAGIGGTLIFKYLNSAGKWATFSKVQDPSVHLTGAAGTYDILFQVPQDWVPSVIDEPGDVALTAAAAANEYYWLAVETLTTYSTNPALTSARAYQALAGNVTGAIIANASGVIDYIQYLATAGATNNATILQVINHTRRTRGLVTLTANPARGRFAFSTSLYVERGDELTLHAVQIDGTTEILNWTDAFFEISL